MVSSFKLDHSYNVCVIDIGSPKLGNLGWCLINVHDDKEFTGECLDGLFPHIANLTRQKGLILGLEAPLFVPLRADLMHATKGRKGEGRRPWSAGAGAQVLALNLPIMIYIFKKIQSMCAGVSFFTNQKDFCAKPNEIMLFEALVSGADKGTSHVNDAQIMARSCTNYSKNQTLPPSILEEEDQVEYFNLAAAALIKCGLTKNSSALDDFTPIYKPKSQAPQINASFG